MTQLASRPEVVTVATRGADAFSKQIRGSSALLVGRLLSVLVNLGVQVLIVRYLTQEAYGAFAYALSFVTLGQTVVTVGLDQSVARFVPIYDEQGEHGKLLGTLVLVTTTMLSLGLATVLLVFGLQGVIADRVISDPQAVSLLLILIFLAPIESLDSLSIGMFAVLEKPGAVFLRRYVLTPVFRLIVVLLLVMRGSGVQFLAVGYLLSGAAGLVIFALLLFRAMRSYGLLQRAKLRTLQVPAREIFAFTLPLLTTDLVYRVRLTMDTVLLGYFGGTAEVAAFRAVLPAANLNEIVISSFALLFTPFVSRLFARDDWYGLNALYWQTAMWLTVLSFPVFALTFSFAEPVTVLVFGERYAGSAPYLALLSLGSYVQAASGFNGLVLRVFAKIRYIVAVNVVTMVVNLALNLLLIPRFGALGAAMGTLGGLLTYNLLKQVGLRFGTGIKLLERDALKVYATVAATAGALWGIGAAFSPSIFVAVPLAALASLVVLGVSRPLLQASQVFPEFMRFRILRILLQGRGQ